MKLTLESDNPAFSNNKSQGFCGAGKPDLALILTFWIEYRCYRMLASHLQDKTCLDVKHLPCLGGSADLHKRSRVGCV